MENTGKAFPRFAANPVPRNELGALPAPSRAKAFASRPMRVSAGVGLAPAQTPLPFLWGARAAGPSLDTH